MDTAFMRKTFALIAKGLIEKEQLLQAEPTRYPYSKAMQHGINMFLAASQWAGSQVAIKYPDEASFLAHFITRPIEEWLDTWEPEVVEQLHLQEEPFYAYDAFAYQKTSNAYVPSSDCYEFLETQDSDIMNGTDERVLYEKIIVLIGLMQLGTRCSDGSCEAAEDLISGFSAIEAEAELVQIGLKLCAAAVISAEQECFQVADGFVQPVQVARFILFRVQLHARQVLIASVAVAFDFCTCRNSFADDLLKCFARDVFHDLHPREQRSPVFRF